MKWAERTFWVLTVTFLVTVMVATTTQASTILKLFFPVQVELYYDEVFFPMAHVIEKFTDRNGVTTFIDRGSFEPRSAEEMALLFPGTRPDQWIPEAEQFGVAWRFRSETPVEMTVPFGKMDTDRGVLTAGMSISSMGVTWRPLSPFFGQ